VQFLEEAAIWSRVVRLAGSGTGAFVATLLALGYTSQQLEQLVNFDIRKLARGSYFIDLSSYTAKHNHEGRSINKLQNGIIMLIFKHRKFRNRGLYIL